MTQLKSWSFSSLTEYEHCPRRTKYRIIDRVPQPEPDPDSPLVRGNYLHERIERFIKGEEPLSESVTYNEDLIYQLRDNYAAGIVNVEGEWGYDATWNVVGWYSATCRMKLDAGVHRRLSNTYRVIDWKSGKKSGNEVKHTMQGQLYAVGALARYPHLSQIDVEFHYIDLPDVKPLVASYTPDKIARFQATYDKRAARMLADTEFRAVANKSNCRFCPFALNNHCPVAVK